LQLVFEVFAIARSLFFHIYCENYNEKFCRFLWGWDKFEERGRVGMNGGSLVG